MNNTGSPISRMDHSTIRNLTVMTGTLLPTRTASSPPNLVPSIFGSSRGRRFANKNPSKNDPCPATKVMHNNREEIRCPSKADMTYLGCKGMYYCRPVLKMQNNKRTVTGCECSQLPF